MASANTKMLGLLLRHELRSILRDQKTVLVSILLPLVVLPALLLLAQATTKQREAKDEARVMHYAIVSAKPEGAQQLEARIGEGLERWSEGGEGPPPKLELESELDTFAQADAALEAGELAAYLSDEPGSAGQRQITVHYRGNRETSQTCSRTLRGLLARSRRHEREQLLHDAGVGVELEALATVEAQDRAEEGESAGLSLGKYLTVVLIMMMIPGGQIVAADIVAGEKERGTLETLLTTAARREEVVLAKLLTIATVALAITTLNILNLMVCVSFGLLPDAAMFAASLPPSTIGLLALLFLPVALQVSCLLLLLSGRASSYKEAQLFMVPVQLLALVPALASLLPQLSLRSAIVLVPVANVSVASRELLSGHVDALALALTVLVNLAIAWAATRHVVGLLGDEQVVTPASGESVEARGGVELFRARVLRWFAVVWASVFVGAGFVPELPGQILLNLVVLMLGSSIVMVKVYGLELREAWSLRRPPALAWLAVLIGVPCGLIVTLGVFELSSLVLPVPESALESFAEGFELDLPTWQLLVLFALAPGVCEEIFFRGMLLHGLRERLGPVATCVVVGLVFGLFHMSLFRLVPTAFLGVMLTAVTMLTGSIFPAMVWHAGHNALGTLASEQFTPAVATQPWVLAGALVGLLVSLALLWRSRAQASDPSVQ